MESIGTLRLNHLAPNAPEARSSMGSAESAVISIHKIEKYESRLCHFRRGQWLPGNWGLDIGIHLSRNVAPAFVIDYSKDNDVARV